MENTPLCGIGAKYHIDGRRQGDTWTDGRRQGHRQGANVGRGDGCNHAYIYTLSTVIQKPVSRFPPLFPLLPLFPSLSPCQLRTITADIEKPHRRYPCPFTISALDTCGRPFPFIEKCKSLQWRVCCTLGRPARPFTAVLQDGRQIQPDMPARAYRGLFRAFVAAVVHPGDFAGLQGHSCILCENLRQIFAGTSRKTAGVCRIYRVYPVCKPGMNTAAGG